MQMSVCCGYLFFIAEQVDYIACEDAGYCGHKNMYILLLTIPALPVSFIRTYTFVSYVVMVGITVAIAGLVSMMGYTTEVMTNKTGCNVLEPPYECSIQTWSTIGVFGHIGFAMFVFEGNAAVINIRSEAKHPE
jgi:amino acid permease